MSDKISKEGKRELLEVLRQRYQQAAKPDKSKKDTQNNQCKWHKWPAGGNRTILPRAGFPCNRIKANKSGGWVVRRQSWAYF